MVYSNIGIGVSDIDISKIFYEKIGFTTVIVETELPPHKCMAKYTGGKDINRKCVIISNNDDNGTIELIQPINGTIGHLNEPHYGDIGIFKIKISTTQSNNQFDKLIKENPTLLFEFYRNNNSIFLYDPDYNIVEVVKGNETRMIGITMGVTNISKSTKFFNDLGFMQINCEKSNSGFDDTHIFPGGKRNMERVIMQNKDNKLETVELVQILDEKVNKLFEDRFWGHIGYVHVAFHYDDIFFKKGYIKSVESTDNFDFGNIKTYFCYVEDSDNNLIEFVKPSKIKILNVECNIIGNTKKWLLRILFILSFIKMIWRNIMKMLEPYVNKIIKYIKLYELKSKYTTFFNSFAKKIGLKDTNNKPVIDLIGDVSSFLLKNGYITYAYHKDDESHVFCEGKKVKVNDICSCSFFGVRTLKCYKKHVEEVLNSYDPIKLGQAPGARAANGNVQYMINLEKELSTFFNREKSIITSSGYLSCMTAVQTICDQNTIILVDEYIHDCLKNGCIISKGKIIRFKHNNFIDALEKTRHLTNKKISIILEGVYSMDATIADLPRAKILKEFLISKGNDVTVLLDEAHSLGSVGKKGRGTEEFFNMEGFADVLCGTFSKAISVVGGWMCSSEKIINTVYLRGSGFVFTCGINPYCARLITAGLRTLDEITKPESIENTVEIAHTLARKFKTNLHKAGIRIGNQLDYKCMEISLAPVIVGSEIKMIKLVKKLVKDGYFLFGAGFPATRVNGALFRVSIRGDMNDALINEISNMLITNINNTDETFEPTDINGKIIK